MTNKSDLDISNGEENNNLAKIFSVNGSSIGQRDLCIHNQDLLDMTEEGFRLLFENMLDGFSYHKMVYDAEGNPTDYVFLEINRAFEDQTGLKKEKIIGKSVLEVLPNTESYWIETYGRVALTGVPEKFENYSQEFSKWYAVSVYSPHINYFAVISRDITEIKQTQDRILKINLDLENKIIDRTMQLMDRNSELEEANAELEEINAMLTEEMSKREEAEEEIKKLNEELENKVIERTNQLQDMNAILEEEIVNKLRIEDELSRERIFTDALFNSVPGMIYLYDNRYKLVRWNKKHEEITGYCSEELAGMNLMDWYKEDEKSLMAVMEGIKRANQNGFGDAEADLQKKDGTIIPMYFTASPINIIGEQYFAGIGIDITERKLADAGLRSKTAFLEAQTNASDDGILVVNQNNKRILTNHRIFELFDVPQHIIEDEDATLLLKHVVDMTKDPEHFLEKVIYLNDHINETSCDEIEFKNGMVLDRHSAPVIDQEGKYYGRIWTFHDITDRKKKENENHYLSYHDVLTGLYNRRFYEEEIIRLDVPRNLPISIIMGDVNGLKLINDAFGHRAGDELLQKSAAAIRCACRTGDIIARWGGDEFVILLPKTSTEEAYDIVKRIKEQYTDVYVNAIHVSISFGWDTKRKIDEDILNILKSAEDYMYKHKIVENEGMRGNAINTIINTLHEKNPREEQHSQRVSEICQNIGHALGFSEMKIGKLKLVGLLHDIGKIAIEEGIINKPGKLTEQEWNEIKRHPDIGYRILSSSHEMLDLANSILAHHERWDGSGYPKGLKGEAIPRTARIIALADSYDAMTSERPYRKALSKDVALAEIRKNAGIQFDPEITRIFIEKVLNESWDQS